MKKSALWMALAFVALGFTATSCADDPDHPDKNVLETPMLQAPVLTHNTATVSWKKCANANMYVYTVNNGPEMMTYEPTVTLEGLQPETTYSFKVKARRDYSEYFEDSEYSPSIKFTTLGKPQEAAKFRITSFADDWDTWFYEYNADGKVSRVYRTADGTAGGALDREWVLAYNGNTVSITGKNEYTLTLNAQGYVATMVDGSKTYDYLYDSEGYMIQAYKDGAVVANATIENGNITKWSKWRDGAEVWKLHTYDSNKNVGEAHCIYIESVGPSRWFVETGLFGKANTNLHTSNQWDYSSDGSTFSYEFDANGCVTKEIKHGSWGDENYFYTYTAAN